MKTTKELGFIRMPNDHSLLPAVLSFSDKIARIAGFRSSDRKKLRLALEEACLSVITKSFDAGENAEYDIQWLKRPDGIEIHVHDMGLPYDPSVSKTFDPAVDLMEQDLEGLGSFLISKTMDEYHFNNLGIKGKEVVMIKYFDTPLIASDQSDSIEPEVVKPPESKPKVEQIHFNIRLMRSGEALEVCRCIYDCYGYSYANENVYFPERVMSMNQNGKLLSAVAVTDDGEIGGHFALINYEKLPSELGIAVTKKKFRGQGFARLLGEFLETEARAAKMKGIQIKEVTAHPYTQYFCRKLGFNDCGLLLAHSPKTLSFKGIADNLVQRNSDVLGFKYLDAPVPRKIYVPLQHEAMILKLFSNIGDSVEVIHPGHGSPYKEKSVTEVNIYTLRSLAEIFILESGKDVMQVMQFEMRKIFLEEIQVIELYISLGDPATPAIVTQLESLGFIFTGILPETRMGDTVVLQYFNGIHINYDAIILVSDVAKELLEYIRKQDVYA
jgi:anti-sigma regulatory factor (Ser/Thr protein kinase)/GNAT superfamily N-acetyltransferase